MQKTYTRINWKNYPNTETPLNESNLNKIDVAVNEIDNRVINLDTSKLDVITGNTLLKDVAVNNTTGVITLTALDGTTKSLNTNLGKIAVNFTYDPETQRLVLTDSDGTVIYISLAELVQNNDFTDTSTIAFSVTNSGVVAAFVKDGSITENHLRPNYLADIRVSEANARASMEEAEGFKDEAGQIKTDTQEIYDQTVGIKEDTQGIHDDTLLQAGNYLDSMEDLKARADDDVAEVAKMVGAGAFTVNMTTGHLEYSNDSYYTFTINTTTGRLEWEVV